MKFLRFILIVLFYLLSLIILAELCVNLLSFRLLLPIKNMNSYGYLSRKTFTTVVPLNKYSSRYISQLVLPYYLFKNKFLDKKLSPYYNSDLNLYGYKDSNGRIIIKEKFNHAENFVHNYAIVEIIENQKGLYGTIDKSGNWVIKPKYSHICSISKFYTRVCLDNDHCGIINIYGDEITKMVYNSKKIKKDNPDFAKYFCNVHTKHKFNLNYCF